MLTSLFRIYEMACSQIISAVLVVGKWKTRRVFQGRGDAVFSTACLARLTLRKLPRQVDSSELEFSGKITKGSSD